MEKDNHTSETFHQPNIEDVDDFSENKCDKNTEHVINSAVNINGQIFTGKRHSDCFIKARSELGMIKIFQEEQGFMTNTGRFVSREDAAIIAFGSNQTNKLHWKLFSEDVW